VQLPPEDARDMSTFNKVPYWLVVEYVLVKDGLSEAAVAERHAAIKAIRDVRLCNALAPSSCVVTFPFCAGSRFCRANSCGCRK
jgi:hypothetical protein